MLGLNWLLRKLGKKMDSKRYIQNLYQGLLHRDPEPGALEHWSTKIDLGADPNDIFSAFIQSDEYQQTRNKAKKLFVPPGHFYSPIVDPAEVQGIYPLQTDVEELPGIKISRESHLEVWKKLLPFLRDIPFPAQQEGDYRYYFENPAFSYGDGSILHAMLRAHRPKRLVEVGSGFSSACAIDTIDRYLEGKVTVSFIEPYPDLLVKVLGHETAKRFAIHATGVQKADTEIFQALDSGDILFIDSTHVMKTGSDVCHELFNILPLLKPGVFIHFHDIFWPFEYGRSWVIEQNRSWNEIYGLRAFLMYNDAFEIYFFNDYFVNNFRQAVQEDYPVMLKNSGGSIWLRKCE